MTSSTVFDVVCSAHRQQRGGGVRGHCHYACKRREQIVTHAHAYPHQCEFDICVTHYTEPRCWLENCSNSMLMYCSAVVSRLFIAAAYRQTYIALKYGNVATVVKNVLRPFRNVHAYR